MTKIERLEGLGSRGEACIVLRSLRLLADGTEVYTYALATGERLRITDESGVFETLNGSRQIRLRISLENGPV